jgi:hypothetical protein
MLKIKPHRLLISSWLLWLFFFIISPYDYNKISPAWPSIILLLFYNLLFYLGLNTKSKVNTINPERKALLQYRKIKKLYWICILISSIGLVLNIYSKLQVIGTLSLSDPFSNREQLMDAAELSGGAIAAVGAILYPFSYTVLLIAIYFENYFKRWHYWAGLIIGFFPPIFAFVLGGRSTLFFYTITLIIVLLTKYSFIDFVKEKVFTKSSFYDFNIFRFNLISIPKRLIKSKYILIFIVLVSFAVVFFSYIQANRVEKWNIDGRESFEMWSSNQEWDYNYNHPINYLLGDKPYESNGFLGFIHYNVHGPFEFIRLVNHVNNFQGVYYGKYEFYVFLKFFGLLGFNIGDDFSTMTEKTLYKPAVYTSFWGPVFVDFGILGGFVFFLIGLLIKRVFINGVRGGFIGLFLYPYLGAILFSTAVINAFVGQNTYIFVSVLLSWILYKTLK